MADQEPGSYAPRPSIGEFYSGKAVLVTGATGFLGKVLVEKLLRSCPDVGRIYVLLRPKRGEDAGKRLASLRKSKVFDHLRETRPDALAKLAAVEGDITCDALGVNAADHQLLVDDVGVVIHLAACIRFVETLRTAVDNNVKATKRVVEFCHQMRHLQAFVYVSTAYTNCTRSDDIAEKVYPCKHDPEEVIHAMEWMDEELVEAVTPVLTGGHPNTYTVTKSLTESYVAATCKTLPTAIVRPSMVGASWQEPFPGWIDSKGAATRSMILVGTGFKGIACGSGDTVADIIPVDVVCNFIIASGWYTATHRPTETTVYHCTSGSDTRTTWGFLLNFTATFFAKNPARSTVRFPSVTFVPIWWLYYTLMFVCEAVPAYALDIACWVFVGRWRYAWYFNSAFSARRSFYFFMNHDWRFSAANFWSVYEAMAPSDRKIFNVDTRALDWTSYFNDYCAGIKAHLLKSDSSSPPKLMLRTLTWLYRFYLVLCVFSLWQALVTFAWLAFDVTPVLWVGHIVIAIGRTATTYVSFSRD